MVLASALAVFIASHNRNFMANGKGTFGIATSSKFCPLWLLVCVDR